MKQRKIVIEIVEHSFLYPEPMRHRMFRVNNREIRFPFISFKDGLRAIECAMQAGLSPVYMLYLVDLLATLEQISAIRQEPQGEPAIIIHRQKVLATKMIAVNFPAGSMHAVVMDFPTATAAA